MKSHFGSMGLPGVPDQLTPLTPDQAAKAIANGYLIVAGQKPTKEILGLLIAQSAEETQNWQKIHNYDFGNTRGEGPDGIWTSFRAGEIINGQEVFLEADLSPESKNKFAAYASADLGAADWIRKLKGRPNWWNGLHTGTVAGYIEGLTSVPKYFTASPALYASLMQNRVNQYAALAKQYAGAAIGLGAVILAGMTAFLGFKVVRRYRAG